MGSLESFKTPSKLTSWFPANVADDGPPENKNEEGNVDVVSRTYAPYCYTPRDHDHFLLYTLHS